MFFKQIIFLTISHGLKLQKLTISSNRLKKNSLFTIHIFRTQFFKKNFHKRADNSLKIL